MAVPIDPPDDVLAARRAARRGRILALPGGVLVFLALFLPALSVCDDPAYPVQFPPVWGPYLLGLAAAIAVMHKDSHTLRAVGVFVIAMAVASLTLFGLMVWSEVFETRNPEAPWLALLWSGAIVAVGTTLRRGVSWERRIARTVWATTIGSAIFFGALATDDNGMFGSWVGLIGAAGLLVGAVCWDLGAPPDGGPPVPPMRAL